MRWTVFCAGLAASLLAHSAGALTLAPESLVFDRLTVRFEGLAAGVPAGGIVQVGSVAAGDTSLVFSALLDSSAAGIGITGVEVVGTPATGAGWIPGADGDIVAAVLLDSGGATFATLEPGVPSDRFFLSVPNLALGAEVAFGRPGVTVPGDVILVRFDPPFLVVPEPALPGLGAALALAAALRRLRRR